MSSYDWEPTVKAFWSAIELLDKQPESFNISDLKEWASWVIANHNYHTLDIETLIQSILEA
jgi:hypothetical protein